MPKNKRPAPKKTSVSSLSSEDQEEALTQTLCDLAADLVAHGAAAAPSDSLRQKEIDFRKIIQKSLYQKKDDILYESLERAQYADSGVYQFLKDSIEEAATSALVRRDAGRAVEVNAFVIPLFVHSSGGLDSRQCFQDQEAFDSLTQSFKEAQLESPDATVVLVNHAYHPDEIDAITYSHLNDMVRDALASMTDKKVTATPAIARSFTGWPEHCFAPQDQAVELRFLLGFALKTTADAFYHVPQEEAAADAYFDARAERFRQWSERVAPLVKRCLGSDAAALDVNFLYQDLFHSGKERGLSEYFMLQLMAALNHALEQHGIEARHARAVFGPADSGDEMVMRVQLYAQAGGAVLASADKPLGAVPDMSAEYADVYDALATIGVKAASRALKFEADGTPREVQPYED